MATTANLQVGKSAEVGCWKISARRQNYSLADRHDDRPVVSFGARRTEEGSAREPEGCINFIRPVDQESFCSAHRLNAIPCGIQLEIQHPTAGCTDGCLDVDLHMQWSARTQLGLANPRCRSSWTCAMISNCTGPCVLCCPIP